MINNPFCIDLDTLWQIVHKMQSECKGPNQLFNKSIFWREVGKYGTDWNNCDSEHPLTLDFIYDCLLSHFSEYTQCSTVLACIETLKQYYNKEYCEDN